MSFLSIIKIEIKKNYVIGCWFINTKDQTHPKFIIHSSLNIAKKKKKIENFLQVCNYM